MTDPVSKQLKDLDNGVFWVFKHVAHLHFGAEGHPVIIFLGSLFTRDMPTLNGCLRIVEITKNIFQKVVGRSATYLETVGVIRL